MQTCVNSKIWILCSWVRESWINVYNCPTRCDYLQFYYIFCRQLYMFRMIPSSIIRSTLKTVITTSGIGGTLFATVRWCGGVGTAVPTPPHQRKLANTLRPVPDVVIIICMCSLWWMMVSSETCRAVCRIYNKTVYICILLDNYWQ